jgi:hypothetical protein
MSGVVMAVMVTSLLAAQQAMQPEIGTVRIDAGLPVGTDRGDYFEAGWLFIDGRLIGRLPVKRDVTLKWGSHDVRVVIGAYTNAKPRYFILSWPRYFVNRGATQTLEVEPVLARAFNGGGTPAGAEVLPTPDPEGALRIDSGDVARFEARVALGFSEEWARLRGSSDVAKIDDVRRQVLQTPPSTPVIWIPVSAGLGGPREFDVNQLLFLARVMRRGFRIDEKEVEYAPSLTPEQRRLAEAAVLRLKQQGDSYEKQVDDMFRDITAALRRAAGRQ